METSFVIGIYVFVAENGNLESGENRHRCCTQRACTGVYVVTRRVQGNAERGGYAIRLGALQAPHREPPEARLATPAYAPAAARHQHMLS